MKIVFIVLLMCLTSLAFGQRTMTLQETIVLAQQQSPAAEAVKLTFQQSDWNYKAFRAGYMPMLSLSGSLPNIQRSISDVLQDDGTVLYKERNQTQGQANLSVSQQVPLTGGRVSVSSGLSRFNSSFDGNDITQWQSSPLVVRLAQPLFQFNEMKWAQTSERMRYQQARRTYVEQMEQVAVDMTDRFFEVYIAQMNHDIARFNVAVNDTIFQLSKGRYEIGMIAENDLLQSELALLNAQGELANAEIAYHKALQQIKVALDLPYDEDMSIIPPKTLPVVHVDLDEAVAQSRQNRPVFLQQEIAEMEAARELSRARHNNGFSANLSASYGLNQSNRSFDQVYQDPLNQQQLNVTFQIPLFQWGRGRANLESALAAQEKTAKDTALRRKELDQEVYFEARQHALLQQQVRVAAQADTIATRRFDVAKSRYIIGKIDITELFNAQREKDSASRAYIQTLRQYWMSYFTIRRLTHFDFERRQALGVGYW